MGTATNPASFPLEAPDVPSGGYEQWLAAAAGVLRKAGKLGADDAADAGVVVEKLARTTDDGLVIPPLGRIAELPTDLSEARRSPRVGAWDIRSIVSAPDATAAASAILTELEGGANSVLVQVGGDTLAPDALASALEGVLTDIAAVVLHPAAGTVQESIAAFASVLGSRPGKPCVGTSLGVDIHAAPLTGDAVLPVSMLEIAGLATDLGIGAFVVDASRVHELGGGDVAELAYAAASGIAYLRELVAAGIDAPVAAGLLSFRYSVTDEQFTQIAKLRAARTLWARILELSDIAGIQQYQHAVTSRAMVTRYDPWVNLLRSTVAGFAAGVGGADAVTVLPFDVALGAPNAAGLRLARNISHLLIGESRVAEVSDPAGGAPAVEILTQELADAAWTLLQELETAGPVGAVPSPAHNVLKDRIAADRERLEARLATRRKPLTGVSEFPNLQESLPVRQSGAPSDGLRWAGVFEELRDSPCAAPVFLATLGPVAAHSTRAGFVTSALAAVGVDVTPAGPTSSADDVIAAYRTAPSPVAVLAGTDAAYADLGAAIIAALRDAGATTILLAGKPDTALEPLLDGRIALGDDLPALGRLLRVRLADTEGVRA